MQLIELKNIEHHYGEISVLDDLTLHMEGNQLTCLLGSSGSGKTTILRLIAGLETPQQGQITIDNQIVTKNNQIMIPPQDRSVGFVFQDLALWPHFTVYKNIAFGLKERNENNIRETVFEILDFFDLRDHVEKYPHQ
ncbi:MAG: ABC transporter ATP-binding protein, partial [Bacteroidetes bacterium]